MFAGERWGSRGSDGRWTGMMGELLRGEADMGVANMYLVLRRVLLVDFTAPYSAEVRSYAAAEGVEEGEDGEIMEKGQNMKDREEEIKRGRLPNLTFCVISLELINRKNSHIYSGGWGHSYVAIEGD